jgi:hypothetical protein
MGNFGLILNLYFLLLLVAYVAIIALASSKLIKSNLSESEKVYWTISLVILNLLAAIAFILFHDYFLSPEKRSGK